MANPTLIAEVWSTRGDHPGPTGRFVIVFEGELVDAGGNVLARFTTGRGALRVRKQWRINTEFRARRVGPEIPEPLDPLPCGIVSEEEARP